MDLSTFSESLRNIAEHHRLGNPIVECFEKAAAHCNDSELQSIHLETVRNLKNGKGVFDAVKEADLPYQAMEFINEVERNGISCDAATFFEVFADHLQPDWAHHDWA
jgi:hypothetical protein